MAYVWFWPILYTIYITTKRVQEVKMVWGVLCPLVHRM